MSGHFGQCCGDCIHFDSIDGEDLEGECTAPLPDSMVDLQMLAAEPRIMNWFEGLFCACFERKDDEDTDTIPKVPTTIKEFHAISKEFRGQ